MYVIREVLHCKPGNVRALADKFKAVNAVLERLGHKPFRLSTDVAGEHFWTLVLESQTESVDAFFAMEGEVMADPGAQEAMRGYHDLVIQGRREIYRLVD